jgi:hypothetical protein
VVAVPEYVTPILAAGGPAALVFIAFRYGPDAALRLLAGAVAVLTRDKERGERCLEVLRILRRTPESRRPLGTATGSAEQPTELGTRQSRRQSRESSRNTGSTA